LLKHVQAYGTLACFVGLIIFFAIALPGTFFTGRNLLNITQQLSMLAIVAFTMTMVMAMGDFDLSVGSMASLAGVVAAVTFRSTESVVLCIAFAVLAGLVGGAINGFLVAYVGILPFVATLGTLTMFSGMAFLLGGGKTIFGGDIPTAFPAFAKGGIPLWTSGEQVLLLPNLTLVAVAVFALTWFVMEKRAFGRHLYAMGGNAEAARLAGVPVKNVRAAAFAIAGLGAATAGLLLVARVASANPIQGAGLMLDAIAAVFLGQTISRNGAPRVFGTLIGVLMLGILTNGLTQLSVDSYVRDILVGAIIIAAVAVSSFEKTRRN
jgi:ribose transport system permease protein